MTWLLKLLILLYAAARVLFRLGIWLFCAALAVWLLFLAVSRL
jgi:hypothetical protein